MPEPRVSTDLVSCKLDRGGSSGLPLQHFTDSTFASALLPFGSLCPLTTYAWVQKETRFLHLRQNARPRSPPTATHTRSWCCREHTASSSTSRVTAPSGCWAGTGVLALHAFTGSSHLGRASIMRSNRIPRNEFIE